MSAKGLPCSTAVPNLVLIAQAVFVLECGGAEPVASVSVGESVCDT